MSKFMIGGRVYDAGSLNDLTLLMVLQLEKETADIGRVLRLADVQAMNDRLDQLKTDEERGNHPDTPWVLAVTIWASRRLAGDGVTFAEAIDVPLDDITFLKSPTDHQKPANPTKGPARKGSGRAAGPHARAAAKT